MLDATTVNPCNHTLCGSCIQSKVMSKKPKYRLCPLYRCRRRCAERQSSSPATEKRNFLLGLRVRCPFSLTYDVCSNQFVPPTALQQPAAGLLNQDQQDDLVQPQFCSKQMALNDLEGHVRTCDYRPVECSFQQKGCQTTVLSRSRASHEISCRFNLNSTRLCENSGSRLGAHESMDSHPANECLQPCRFQKDGCKVSVPFVNLEIHERCCCFNANTELCEKCGSRIGANDSMEGHRANNCLRPCPFNASGCRHRRDYGDLEEHVATCPFRNILPAKIANGVVDGGPDRNASGTTKPDPNGPGSDGAGSSRPPDVGAGSNPSHADKSPDSPHNSVARKHSPEASPPHQLSSPKYTCCLAEKAEEKDIGRWCGPWKSRGSAHLRRCKTENSTRVPYVDSSPDDGRRSGCAEYRIECPCCKVEVLKSFCGGPVVRTTSWSNGRRSSARQECK
ncbi:hypothetical protein CBR_g32261 [Chara braunii]|uniref:TRAF-type domain-containing protein n=1 Tax=Chara braunii TaxID=69332 RepID=A0A388JNA1_CHABU|nr:hypothetical protein CBR_g32261 [Chara braunii]|eukprot:GBG59245.1 hypothetical protein CBR_g32261 [Chara braunii]